VMDSMFFCSVLFFVFFFFFFSSRRRHTRFKCDWSSDVCSSDLARLWGRRRPAAPAGAGAADRRPRRAPAGGGGRRRGGARLVRGDRANAARPLRRAGRPRRVVLAVHAGRRGGLAAPVVGVPPCLRGPPAINLST